MEKKKFETPNVTVEELSAELVITNLKLKEANQQLIKEQNARNEMFSNISHDLRSPITAIKNAIELLSDMQEYSKEQVEPLLHLMGGRVQILERLINDIFLLVSLENNCAQFSLQDIPLDFFLEDYFFAQDADHRYSKRNLHLNIPDTFSATVSADTNQLTRVLDNLFTNALKYSHENDSIELGAYTKEQTVYVYVKDTGIGIAAEDLEKIFERCYIVEKARTPGISSTGLGLSITKAIITRLNGSIWCESTPDKGSCFTFCLPRIS